MANDKAFFHFLQVRLEPRIQKEILAELRTPDRLRESLDVVDIVLGFLSSGGSKTDKPLRDYIDKVIRMRRRPFSLKVCIVVIFLNENFFSLLYQAREYCRLTHILSLWETLSVELSRQTCLLGQVTIAVMLHSVLATDPDHPA